MMYYYDSVKELLMDEPTQTDSNSAQNSGNPFWQAPTLTFLGNIKDLVQGGGKSPATGEGEGGGGSFKSGGTG